MKASFSKIPSFELVKSDGKQMRLACEPHIFCQKYKALAPKRFRGASLRLPLL
jgi:hypothetical protein